LSIFGWIVTAYAVVFSLAWCALYLRSMHTILVSQSFDDRDPTEPDDWPTLSIIVPACNEADTIEQALQTLLGQDYPDLEIVLVNDRSTDGTGEIIDRIAEKDGRIRTVHIDTLPDGWLGKVHALHLATRESTGEWVLYTDADVHYEEGTLRKAVAVAASDELDHLALLPRVQVGSFWLDILIRAFGLLLFQKTRARLIGRPGSNAFIGIGAFNLVRRSAFDKTEGFEWLRMEVADDVGLGLMLQRSGARPAFAIAVDSISVVWQPSIRAMAGCLDRLGHFGLPTVLAGCASVWAVFFGPLVAILCSPVPYLWLLGVAAYLCTAVNAVAWTARIKRIKYGIVPSLLVPFGFLAMSILMIRSVVLCKVRGGVVWRDTLYPIEALRAGRRVRL